MASWLVLAVRGPGGSDLTGLPKHFSCAGIASERMPGAESDAPPPCATDPSAFDLVRDDGETVSGIRATRVQIEHAQRLCFRECGQLTQCAQGPLTPNTVQAGWIISARGNRYESAQDYSARLHQVRLIVSATPGRCMNPRCAKELVGARRKFCSDRCRYALRWAATAATRYCGPRTCAGCAEQYVGRGRKYCTRTCRELHRESSKRRRI